MIRLVLIIKATSFYIEEKEENQRNYTHPTNHWGFSILIGKNAN